MNIVHLPPKQEQKGVRVSEQERERRVVPVHECYDDGEAEVVIALLRDHGIEGYANSEVPHSVLPITADGLGKVTVLVDQDFAEKARSIIAEQRGPEDGPDPG